MTLFECLQTYLATSVSLGTKVPNGFLPGYLAEDAQLPVGVIRYVSGKSEPPTHDNGPSPWSTVRIEFTVWGADYPTMEQAAAIIGKMFQTSTAIALGGMGNGVFCPQSIQGPRDVREPSRRLSGMQIDIIGLLNGDTIA